MGVSDLIEHFLRELDAFDKTGMGVVNAYMVATYSIRASLLFCSESAVK